MKKRDIRRYILAGIIILVAFGLAYFRFFIWDKSTTKPTPLPETIRVLPLGNSITQTTNGYNSFRRNLWFKLQNAGYSIDFIGSLNQNNYCGSFLSNDFDPDHEGHWGWRTDEILNGRDDGCSGRGRLEEWLEGYTADLVAIHLGSNDLFQQQSVRSTLNELERVIDLLRKDNPWVTIFLARLIPTDDQERNNRIITLNDALPRMVSRKNKGGSKVILVDQYTGFDPVNDTFDGIHPNEIGEEKMAEIWFLAIDAFLSE